MEVPTKFWKEYFESDALGRDSRIANLVTRLDELKEIKEDKIRRHCLKLALIGYFDDIEDYFESEVK